MKYPFRNLKTGSVYDVVGFAKNQYGWSDHSKTFTFFNKGVGKSDRLRFEWADLIYDMSKARHL